MANVASEIQAIFENEIATFCDNSFTYAAVKMRDDLEKSGVVLTQELIRSIFTERHKVTGDLEIELRLGMRGYGRYKDMKVLQYDQFLPQPGGDLITGIKKFVENVGVRNFDYVPGYFKDAKRRAVLPDSRAKNRIAWGVAMSIIQRGRIKRKSPFYNLNRGKIYDKIINHIMKKLPEESLKKLIAFYETPFYDTE